MDPVEGVESALIQAYKSGEYSISWLRITEYPREQEDFTTIVAFLYRLQDRTTRASKTLRHLELRNMKNSFLDERVVKAIVSMLAANRTLEFLRISLCKRYYEVDSEPKLMGTNGKQGALRPLAPVSRYALLSVLQARFDPSKSVTGQLDHAIVASIFAFAVERRVCITVENMDY